MATDYKEFITVSDFDNNYVVAFRATAFEEIVKPFFESVRAFPTAIPVIKHEILFIIKY